MSTLSYKYNIISSLVPLELVDINFCWHNGFLYHAFLALEKGEVTTTDGADKVTTTTTWTKVTKVIKSNQTLQEVIAVPARPGALPNEHIYALTDGTLIVKDPKPSKPGTFSPESISNYINGDTPVFLLSVLLKTILRVLKCSVWLPRDEDYYVLALSVVMTYVFPIFDAIPFLLANGPTDTGKSELGKLMASLCANGQIFGETSPAAAIREADENRGLMVFDDLEKIGAHIKGAVAKDPFLAMLLVSYKRASGFKVVTDSGTGKTNTLNFYGPKMFTNIGGIGKILATRTLKITTAKMPPNFQRSAHGEDLAKLRNSCHIWAMQSAREVATAYRALPMAGSREEEITAPLRVLAKISGIDEFEEQLDFHLRRASGRSSGHDLPSVFEVEVDELLDMGVTQVSPTQVRAKMEQRLRSHGLVLPRTVNSVWVGRRLRQCGYVSREDLGKREKAEGGFLRFYTLLRPETYTPPSLPIPYLDVPQEQDAEGIEI